MDIKLGSVIILAGKPAQGKSYLIKYFFYKNRKKFDFGIVLTKTKFNGGYSFIPTNYVHPDYSEEKIKALMKIQSDLIEKGINKQAFIIIDDCLTSEFNNQLFTDLITQHRHYNITVIISTQYIYKINPTIRECANYAIMFRQSTKRSIEALYESFGNHFNNYKEFKTYLTDNTGDYQFIFVDINSQSDKLNEIYNILKAPSKIPDFKLKFNKKY